MIKAKSSYAVKVDRELQKALKEMYRAEKTVVYWFSEMVRRRLHRDLGFSSIHQYASEVLGFSENQTYRFLRLSKDLEQLPKLRKSVEKGGAAGQGFRLEL